eukprot:scaffold34639_cov206-Amphora_coffeaeformis.AAC.6
MIFSPHERNHLPASCFWLDTSNCVLAMRLLASLPTLLLLLSSSSSHLTGFRVLLLVLFSSSRCCCYGFITTPSSLSSAVASQSFCRRGSDCGGASPFIVAVPQQRQSRGRLCLVPFPSSLQIRQSGCARNTHRNSNPNVGNGEESNNIPIRNNNNQKKNWINLPSLLQRLSWFTPLWTVLAAAVGLHFPDVLGPTSLGSVTVVSRSLFVLMLSMALNTTAQEFVRACKSPFILMLNAACCFGLMPLFAISVARVLHCTTAQTTGTILLGCVCGGQASNLFTLLAGGDVSLSVVCTLSTTLLGVVFTPLLVQSLGSFATGYSSAVVVDGWAVLKSVVSLVMGPLVLGIGLGQVAPRTVEKVSNVTPLVGIGATLLLVAGGAANAAAGATAAGVSGWKNAKTLGASILLPMAGGAASLLVTLHLQPTQRRAVVMEVLSKSPTLAYVLSRKHFSDAAVSSVPAASMVTLAVIGALVASLWRLIPLPSSLVQEG